MVFRFETVAVAARDAEDADAAAAAAQGSLNSRGHNEWVMSDLVVVRKIYDTLRRIIIIILSPNHQSERARNCLMTTLAWSSWEESQSETVNTEC